MLQRLATLISTVSNFIGWKLLPIVPIMETVVLLIVERLLIADFSRQSG
jgi:hypothetical protein